VAGGGAARFGRGLLPISLSTGAEIVRVHQTIHGAAFFGPAPGLPPQNRFDAPGGEFRVLYGATELHGAFVETVLRRPGRILRRAIVDERSWSRLQTQRDLQLVKLFDEGLQWHGLDAGEIAADDYGATRALALDLFGAFPNVDGLAYRSRYDNGQICFALFDRCDPRDLTHLHTQALGDVPRVVDQLMARYGAVFDTSPAP